MPMTRTTAAASVAATAERGAATAKTRTITNPRTRLITLRMMMSMNSAPKRRQNPAYSTARLACAASIVGTFDGSTAERGRRLAVGSAGADGGCLGGAAGLARLLP